MPGTHRQNSMFKKTKGYVQKGNPFAVTSCGRRRNTGTPLFAKAEPRRTIGKGKNFNPVSKDKSATGGAAGGGMTEKGVKEYKRKNPGSKLETAVTTKPSKLKPGSKDANRRKSFCARSRSWKSERGLAARRRWNC
tara:strand:- start:1256 stop:1663 length:408 start_codon:yes stop_codon:yes gene_type:complete